MSMTPKIFFSSSYQIDMPELIGKVFFGIWGVFPHVFASQKVRFWGSAEKSRVRLRGMGLAGRDVQSGRTCEAELLLTVSLLSACFDILRFSRVFTNDRYLSVSGYGNKSYYAS